MSKSWVTGSVKLSILCAVAVVASHTAHAQQSGWVEETQGAPLGARVGHASAVFDNRMWVLGGAGYQSDVWSSPDGVTWTLETSAPGWDGRQHHTAVAFNNRLWVMGGQGTAPPAGPGHLNDVWSSPDGITWTLETGAAAWVPRALHTSTVFDNRLWVIGGEDGASMIDLSDVWSSPDGVVWTKETDSAPWGPRRSHATTVFANQLWVLGGLASGFGGAPKGDAWSSSDGINWLLATSSAAGGRAGHTAFSYLGFIWMAGGNGSSPAEIKHHNDLWYSVDGVNWTLEGAGPWSERQHHTSEVFGGRPWILGGGLKNGPLAADCVWSWRQGPPVITSPLGSAAYSGSFWSYTITAEGAPAPTFSAVGMPAWMSHHGNVLSGVVPALHVGQYFSVSLTATNLHGADSRVLQVAVTEAKDPQINTPKGCASLPGGGGGHLWWVALGFVLAARLRPVKATCWRARVLLRAWIRGRT